MLWLAQVPDAAADAMAMFLFYAGVVLIIFLIQVAILRWIIRVNVIVKNQEKMIDLLRQLVAERRPS